jgi:hypothetical protein
MENIRKNLSKIMTDLISHIEWANSLDIYDFEDILDNFIDCNCESYNCDAMELKSYLMKNFNNL